MSGSEVVLAILIFVGALVLIVDVNTEYSDLQVERSSSITAS